MARNAGGYPILKPFLGTSRSILYIVNFEYTHMNSIFNTHQDNEILRIYKGFSKMAAPPHHPVISSRHGWPCPTRPPRPRTARLPVTWEPEVFFLGLTSGGDWVFLGGLSDSDSGLQHIYTYLSFWCWLMCVVHICVCCFLMVRFWMVFFSHMKHVWGQIWVESKRRRPPRALLPGADTVIEVPIMRWEHETVSGPWEHILRSPVTREIGAKISLKCTDVTIYDAIFVDDKRW